MDYFIELFSCLLFLNCYQLKIIFVPKWYVLGSHILITSVLFFLKGELFLVLPILLERGFLSHSLVITGPNWA
jgi:hypothetical protein